MKMFKVIILSLFLLTFFAHAKDNIENQNFDFIGDTLALKINPDFSYQLHCLERIDQFNCKKLQILYLYTRYPGQGSQSERVVNKTNIIFDRSDIKKLKKYIGKNLIKSTEYDSAFFPLSKKVLEEFGGIETWILALSGVTIVFPLDIALLPASSLYYLLEEANLLDQKSKKKFKTFIESGFESQENRLSKTKYMNWKLFKAIGSYENL